MSDVIKGPLAKIVGLGNAPEQGQQTAPGPEKTAERKPNHGTDQCHGKPGRRSPAAGQHRLDGVAHSVEPGVAERELVGRKPGITGQGGKRPLGSKERQSLDPLRKVAVLGVEAVVIKSPIGVARRDMANLVRRHALVLRGG